MFWTKGNLRINRHNRELVTFSDHRLGGLEKELPL